MFCQNSFLLIKNNKIIVKIKMKKSKMVRRRYKRNRSKRVICKPVKEVVEDVVLTKNELKPLGKIYCSKTVNRNRRKKYVSNKFNEEESFVIVPKTVEETNCIFSRILSVMSFGIF